LRAANDVATHGEVRRGRVRAWGGGIRETGNLVALTCAHELVEESSLRVHCGEGGGAVEKP
jgi:hypothetical protein